MAWPCLLHWTYRYYWVFSQILRQRYYKCLISLLHFWYMISYSTSTHQKLAVTHSYCWVKVWKFLSKFILIVRLWTYSLNSFLPSIHSPSLFNQFQHKQFKIAFIFYHLRKEREKSSLTDLYLFISCSFLSFLLWSTAKRTTIKIQKCYKAIVTDKDRYIFVFSAFCIEFISMRLMILLWICSFIFLE